MIFRINIKIWDLKEKTEKQIRAEMYFYYQPEDIVVISENGRILDRLRLDELFNKPTNNKYHV